MELTRELAIKLTHYYPDKNFFIRDNNVYSKEVGTPLVTSLSELNYLPDIDIHDFNYSDVHQFVKELFSSEPLWSGVMELAKKDLEVQMYFELCTQFILTVKTSELSREIFQDVWSKLLTRVFILVNGNLASKEDSDRWNKRVKRLQMPIWLEINVLS